MKTIIYLTLTALLLVACKTSSTVLIPSGDKENIAKYKCVNYMGWTGNTAEKKPPGQISKSVIQDELVITKVEQNETQFKLILRSHTSSDQDFSAYKVKLNGSNAPVLVGSNTVEVKDYEYTGTFNVAYVRSSVLNFNLSEPAQKIFRVIEREITFTIPKTVDLTTETKIELGAKIDHNGARLGAIYIFKPS